MARTIVLIDDDPDDILLMEEAIAVVDSSAVCISFTDPCKAVDRLTSEDGLNPSFIFIDINMPRMMGDECLRRLRSVPTLTDVKIAIISTTMSAYNRTAFHKDGANFTLAKPIKMTDYYDILEEILS